MAVGVDIYLDDSLWGQYTFQAPPREGEIVRFNEDLFIVETVLHELLDDGSITLKISILPYEPAARSSKMIPRSQVL